MRRTLYRLRRGLRMPPAVIATKVGQALRARLDHVTGALPRSERRVQAFWARDMAEVVEALRAEGALLVHSEGVLTARAYAVAEPAWRGGLATARQDLERGRIRVFGRDYEFGADPAQWPWTRDWTCGHVWPNRYHTGFDHYEPRSTPFDVKHPWEFSRLNFLMRPALSALVDGDERFWARADEVLAAFQQANPYGYSVNWCAMECAMRGINLALLAQMAAHADGENAGRFLRRCLALGELQGRFVRRHLEYSDVRGNHFAANVAALVLLGSTLRGQVGEAAEWLQLGARALGPEILEQFLADGVQIEKSVPYHRLVAQLFLLATLACDRAGLPVSMAARARLREAFVYMRSCVRPDGLSPTWGDNDDARACWFDAVDPRDHRPLLNFAARALGDPALVASDELPPEAALLLGLSTPLAGTYRGGARYFQAGGMVTCQGDGGFLMVDVGEIGLRGHGGHGHLDATSFELALRGVPLVVDPGSCVYTGNPAERQRFRSSASHNLVTIDGQEIATLPLHPWALGREADPVEVGVEVAADAVTIVARHRGFERLPQPVRYRRTLRYDAETARLEGVEAFEADAAHEATLHLHLAPGVVARPPSGGTIDLEASGKRFWIEVPAGARTQIVDDWVSPAYFQKVPATVVRLSWHLAAGASEARWRIGLAGDRT